MKDRHALLTVNAELTFRSLPCAFFALLFYRIRLSPEHPKPVIALISCHLKCDSHVKAASRDTEISRTKCICSARPSFVYASGHIAAQSPKLEIYI